MTHHQNGMAPLDECPHWSRVIEDNTRYVEVQARITEGILRSRDGQLQAQFHQGVTNIPAMSGVAKYIYSANKRRIDAGVEQAVDHFRVNAFFQLLDHVANEE